MCLACWIGFCNTGLWRKRGFICDVNTFWLARQISEIHYRLILCIRTDRYKKIIIIIKNKREAEILIFLQKWNNYNVSKWESTSASHVNITHISTVQNKQMVCGVSGRSAYSRLTNYYSVILGTSLFQSSRIEKCFPKTIRKKDSFLWVSRSVRAAWQGCILSTVRVDALHFFIG